MKVNVIFSTCCPHFIDKTTFLKSIAIELSLINVNVEILLANHEVCSHIIRLNSEFKACQKIYNNFFKQLGTDLEMNVIRMDSDKYTTNLANKIWKNIYDIPYPERKYGSYNLFKICEVSICRYTENFEGFQNKVIDSFQKDTLHQIIFLENYWGVNKPDLVIFFGGHFHQDRVVYLLCQVLNIRSYAIESSFLKDRIYFDNAGVTGNRGNISSQNLLHWCEINSPTDSRVIQLDQIMSESFKISKRNLKNKEIDRKNLRSKYYIEDQEKIVLFLGQVPYDSSVISDSGDFQNQFLTINCIADKLSSFRNVKFFVRPHPKNFNFYHVNNISKTALFFEESLYYSLLMTDVAVTVNSQSAIQAAWLGIPVIVLGRAFYSGKGFTIDINGKKELLDGAFKIAFGKNDSKKIRQNALSYIDILESNWTVNTNDVKSIIMDKILKIYN